MRRYTVATLMLLTLGLISACRRTPPEAAPPQVIRRFQVGPIVLQGNETGLRDEMTRVIRTAEELGPIWKQAVSTQFTPVTEPTIDFTRNMLLVIAAGRRYDEDDVRVDSIIEKIVTLGGQRESVLKVYYTELEGCRRPDSRAAYPLQIVQIQRYESKVEFELPQKASNCR
jgi:hypothetical protein